MPNENVNLFCLPFAGGNKYSYRLFSDISPAFLNIIPLEYPGRGSRAKEKFISDVNILVEDIYQQVINNVNDGSYAIYGHSMGGLMAYLLTLKILKHGHQQPAHIFITGTKGPSAPSRLEKKRYLLPKDEFINEIKELGGMPDEILQSRELLEYLEPILRNDFKIIETYKHQDTGPLNLPFTVITGTEEDMEEEDILLWQNESSLPVDFKKMTGRHFFILDHTDNILNIISKKLLNKSIYLNHG